eukprot:scaffold105666_cov50-Prasinocladus_malaysianus.AAC.1
MPTEVRKDYKRPSSALKLPPGTEWAYQYSPRSVYFESASSARHSLRERWTTQTLSQPVKTAVTPEEWESTVQASTWKKEDWGYHSSKFYSNKFSLIGAQGALNKYP